MTLKYRINFNFNLELCLIGHGACTVSYGGCSPLVWVHVCLTDCCDLKAKQVVRLIRNHIHSYTSDQSTKYRLFVCPNHMERIEDMLARLALACLVGPYLRRIKTRHSTNQELWKMNTDINWQFWKTSVEICSPRHIIWLLRMLSLPMNILLKNFSSNPSLFYLVLFHSVQLGLYSLQVSCWNL